MVTLYKSLEDAELAGIQTSKEGNCDMVYQVGTRISIGFTPNKEEAMQAVDKYMDVRAMYKHPDNGWVFLNK